jgi:DNA-3-methyladenine glycosylase II
MSHTTEAAAKHFKTSDPIMAKLLKRAEKTLTLPTPKPPEEYFASIVTAVISQQISTHAARAIKGRVVELLDTITPDTVSTVQFEELKACGLFEKKTTYLKHNAAIWHEIPYGDFVHLTDEAIIHELTKLYGIGRWTAEMFLIFSLARPDVFSYGDLGLMQSLYHNYGYKKHYTKKIATTVNSWSPHRSIASLVLWHTKDTNPT